MPATVERTTIPLSIELLMFSDRRPSSAELIRAIRRKLRELKGDYSVNLNVVNVEEHPYLAEHYKLVATPALVKTHPLPSQVLVGNDLDTQLELWWPRWQNEVESLAQQSPASSLASIEQTTEILKLSEEIFNLRHQLEEAKDRLLFKDRIIAMLAHDMRNPLSATSLAVETLEQHQDTLSPQLRRQLFQHARTQTRQMEQMITDILEAARGTTSELSVVTKELQFTDLCREVVAELAERIEAKQLRLETDIPSFLPTIHADPDKIRQVLVNLLDNAAKYTPSGGEIRIMALHRTRQKIEVCVSDTGPGIPEEATETIFSDAVRLSRDRSREGYGIGLSLCQRIIRAHYGRIWVDSAPGEGSSFHFTLPVYRA
jgi:two-component system clock-associated histidine kinase SasA